MRRRTPPEGAETGLFTRPVWAWDALGYLVPIGAYPAPGWDAACALVERGALAEEEIAVLRAAAAGHVPELDCTPDQAASLLARWEGPIPGLKLRRLPHWRNGLRAV